MFGKFTVSLVAFALAGALFASPVFAQDAETAESPPGTQAVREVDGEFVLHLSGEVAQGYSFYIEADFGSGSAFLCTTDAEMIAIGHQECASGDVTLPFVAPEGEEISYRILGNPGNELSQFVVSEGTVAVSEGMVIEGSYAFSDRPAEVETPEAPVGDQYGIDEAAPVIEAEPVSMTDATQEETTVEATTQETTSTVSDEYGGLPRSGGFPVMAVAGVSLLIAGGFLFRKPLL